MESDDLLALLMLFVVLFLLVFVILPLAEKIYTGNSDRTIEHEYQIIDYKFEGGSYYVSYLYDGIPRSYNLDENTFIGVYHNNTIQTAYQPQVKFSWDNKTHLIYNSTQGIIYYIPIEVK